MATPIDVVFKCKMSDGKSVKSYVIYLTKTKIQLPVKLLLLH